MTSTDKRAPESVSDVSGSTVDAAVGKGTTRPGPRPARVDDVVDTGEGVYVQDPSKGNKRNPHPDRELELRPRC